MKLGHLLQAIERFTRAGATSSLAPNIEISGLAYDSRQVQRGEMFVALKGLRAAGADFAVDAVARGAAVVMAEQPPSSSAAVPWV